MSDESKISIAPLSEEGEFDWSPEIQGYILSAGFLGYFVTQIPGGLLSQAYGAKNVFLGGVLLASLAHLLSPFAAWGSCYLMILIQFLRGIGQGFHSPANSVIAAKWFPRHERGFLNSLIFSGGGVGSFITSVTSGALCSSNLFGGWPSAKLYSSFFIGGLGLVFSLCIHLFLYESPKDHPRIGMEELKYILENQESDLSQKPPPTPWKEMLTSVPVYMMTYSVFSHFWTTTHQMSEHPTFLGNILHFPIKENGILNSIPFGFQIILIFLGGWISKWLNTHGYVGVDKLEKDVQCFILWGIH
ncbi:putative inorganic phosphate cotransporter like protein [Argiope bruennichi]|uniref:Putative inorganic phosphate cotransporter like protein n=1 Tax=Argiope bruennichi TaxID=94029 RepID=A0A8T0FBN2_ARGBR|nr:putative inorganic phosphate cotransporter like protein [Argiope bruennichi]